MRVILKKRGKDFDTRATRILKNSITVFGGVALRVNYRERAKEIVH